MIEDAAYKLLWEYLDKINTDAGLLDPDRELLEEVIRDSQDAPRPKGPYAVITFLTDRDTGEVDGECYEDQEIESEPRVVLSKARGVELLFRITIFASRTVNYASLFSAALLQGEASVWLSPFIVRSVSEIKRAPEMVQQQMEGQAHFDVTLGAIVTEKLLVDVIETGDIEIVGAGGVDVVRNVHFVKP